MPMVQRRSPLQVLLSLGATSLLVIACGSSDDDPAIAGTSTKFCQEVADHCNASFKPGGTCGTLIVDAKCGATAKTYYRCLIDNGAPCEYGETVHVAACAAQKTDLDSCLKTK